MEQRIKRHTHLAVARVSEVQSKCLGQIQFGITCRSDVVWLKDSRAKSVYKLFGSRNHGFVS